MTNLIPHSAIRDVMARVNLSNVFYHAHEIVGARPRKLKVVLSARVSSAVRVREHVELKGEMYRSIDFSCPLVTALLEFEPLCVKKISKRACGAKGEISYRPTLS